MTSMRSERDLIPPQGKRRGLPPQKFTHDQMVQAARSGKQNIAEGSMVSGTSKKTELKLVGVSRASLEELLLNYQDFLRQKGLPLWDKGHAPGTSFDHPPARRTAISASTSSSGIVLAAPTVPRPNKVMRG